MYLLLLTIHSLVRWLVVGSLLLAIARGARGWRGNRPYTPLDDRTRTLARRIVDLQFLLGVSLYIISPTVRYFLSEFPASVKVREARFFGMEHITVMVIAVAVINIGSARVQRQTSDRDRFRTLTVWFAAGLFLILTSVPWPFSPFTSRPGWRW